MVEPVKSPLQEKVKGPLWYSGPGTSWTPSMLMPTIGVVGSTVAGRALTMTFGRPVLPPDVRATQDGETASGNGASARSAGGCHPGASAG